MIDKEFRIETDKALAYFLGWRIDNTFPDKGKTWRRGNAVELESTFKFSTDWNALMEVNTAISKLDGAYIKITNGVCRLMIYSSLECEIEYPRSKNPIEEV